MKKNVFALLLGLFGIALFGAEHQISAERIEFINSTINKHVDMKEDMSDAKVQKLILDEIGAKVTLKPVTPMKKANLKVLNERARRVMEKKYGGIGKRLEAKLRKEAESMYQMFQLKDKVTLSYKRGSSMIVVTGTLYKIEANSILVDNKTIPFIDMDLATRAKFDAEAQKALREKHITDGMAKHKADTIKYQQRVFDRLLEKQNEENEKNGYIFLEREKQWTTADVIARELLEIESNKYKKRKKEEERKLALKRKKEEERARKKAEEEAAAQQQLAEQNKNTRDQQPEGEVSDMFAENSMERQMEEARESTRDEAMMANGEANPNRQTSNEVVDVLGGNSSAMPEDTGGDFIAMSQQELAAAVSRIKVNEVTYKELMEKVEAKLKEINSTYYGIDADQGFKKALWGFTETDVYYALSKEKESAFLNKYVVNRYDIIYPKGSRPARIFMHFYFGKLNQVDVHMGDLTHREFDIYKNSLNRNYGKSDTQLLYGNEDIFQKIQEGALAPDQLPVVIKQENKDEEQKEQQKEQQEEQQQKQQNKENKDTPELQPYVIVWEGRLSRGVLRFYYDTASSTFKNVIFFKRYMPERLEAEKRKQEEKAKAAAEKEAAEKEAAENGAAENGAAK